MWLLAITKIHWHRNIKQIFYFCLNHVSFPRVIYISLSLLNHGSRTEFVRNYFSLAFGSQLLQPTPNSIKNIPMPFRNNTTRAKEIRFLPGQKRNARPLFVFVHSPHSSRPAREGNISFCVYFSISHCLGAALLVSGHSSLLRDE